MGVWQSDRVRLSGIRTVAEHEFGVRLRTGKWQWMLGVWFAVITAFTALMHLALARVATSGPHGVAMFGGLMLWVLGLAMLVAPALGAQSINGERDRGTLATLQVTRLSATEIAAGKLLAAWGTIGVFVACTLPHVVWCIAAGGVSLLRVLVVLVVVVLLCGVVCAVALALSALLARGIMSAVTSYLFVFALTVGTVIAFGLGTALSTTTEERTVIRPAAVTTTSRFVPCRQTSQGCEEYTVEVSRPHPERVWWLLAPNPFVVLADAAPRTDPRIHPMTGEPVRHAFDPLGSLGSYITSLRNPGEEFVVAGEGKPVWPWGLGFDVLLGVGAFAVTARRLRTPLYRLPRGTRIA